MIWAAPGPAGALPGLTVEEEQRPVWGIPAVAAAEILAAVGIPGVAAGIPVVAGIPAVVGSPVVPVAGILAEAVAEIPAAVEVHLPAAVAGSR